MEKIMHYIALLFIVAANLIAQDCKGILKINSNDTSALIFVNDNFIGKGNVTTEVEKGEYIVTVLESLVKWNGYQIIDTINVEQCDKEYTMEFNVAKKVFVDSRPQNAEIIENDSLVGYTPQYIDTGQFLKLQLKKGTSFTEVNYNSLIENKIQYIDFSPEIKAQSFTDSPLFKVLLGSATVFGATAAYFKLKADKKYDDYLFSQDRNVLNEVDKFDL